MAPVAGRDGPPEPDGDPEVGVADHQQGDEVLEAHTRAVVHGVEAGHAGVGGHVAEWRLLLVLHNR